MSESRSSNRSGGGNGGNRSGHEEQQSLFEQILGRTEERGRAAEAARPQLEAGLFELARQLEEDGEFLSTFAGNIPGMIDVALARVDQRLSGQLDQILHHEKFQKLEASWRNLFRLVEQAEGGTETGDDIQVKILDVTRRELERDLRVGTPASPIGSGLFEKVHRNAFNTYGAVPYAALIGDLEFGYEPRDVDLLQKLSGVAAAAHAPFIAAASPAMFDWQDSTGLANAGDLERQFKQAKYDDWNAFRGRPDSRYVGLCMPKVLTRLPYGSGGEPVDSFSYTEGIDGRDHRKYLWGNASYAFAGRLVESFAEDGWCVSICGPNGGGMVDNLPLHPFKTDQGEVAIKCPTEVQISADREFALEKLGFIPLVHKMGEAFAVFNWAPSCHLPDRYTTDEGNANAFLAAQLPYIMAASRIAHYLKIIATEDIGSTTSASAYQRKLQEWINQYVIDQDDISEDQARRKPLRKAQIEVFEIPGRPGFYSADAFITPHFKLQGLSVTVSLVANLPGGRSP